MNRLTRMWINQPSWHQILHKMHGARVLYDTEDQMDEAATALEAMDALKARVRELEEALRPCQSILALLVDPEDSSSIISTAGVWVKCIAAEAIARAALKEDT